MHKAESGQFFTSTRFLKANHYTILNVPAEGIRKEGCLPNFRLLHNHLPGDARESFDRLFHLTLLLTYTIRDKQNISYHIIKCYSTFAWNGKGIDISQVQILSFLLSDMISCFLINFQIKHFQGRWKCKCTFIASGMLPVDLVHGGYWWFNDIEQVSFRQVSLC